MTSHRCSVVTTASFEYETSSLVVVQCQLLYSGKLLKEKTFANWWKMFRRELFRTLSRIVHSCHAKGHHAPKLRKLLWISTKLKFAKVFSLKSFPLYSKCGRWNQGPEDPRIWGPKDRGTQGSRVLIAVLHCSSQSTDNLCTGNATSPNSWLCLVQCHYAYQMHYL